VTDSKDKKVLLVECPQCQKKFDYHQSEFRPFCCERCKMADLYHWVSGNYAIPGKEANLDKTDEEEGENE